MTNSDDNLAPPTQPAENIIQLGTVKKLSVRPPDPALIKPAAPKPEKKDLMLAPYPDGVLFKCSPAPGAKNGQFVIHDGAGTIVGGCINQAMANLFCEALYIYFQAAKQNADAQIAAQPADAATPPEGTMDGGAK